MRLPRPGPQVYVWRPEGEPAFLAARSARWLAKTGFDATILRQSDLGALAQNYAGRGLLFVRAGLWGGASESLTFPPPSSSGLGLCAIAVPPAAQATAAERRWSELLAAAGGTVTAHTEELHALGLPPFVYLDHAACETLLTPPSPLSGDILRGLLLRAARLRIVSWPGLDVFSDSRMRVLQVVTSLQRGGAERIALNLSALLAQRGIYARLAAPFQPTRACFETPAAWLDLVRLRRNGESCFAALLRSATSFDVLHAHLFKPPELAQLCATGVPTVVTVHNSRAGWADGFAEFAGEGLALIAACSLEVEAELRAAGMKAPVRTIWNGIDFDAFSPAPAHTATRESRRRTWGFADDDLVLLAIANPRAQKRLHRLPPILAAVQAALARKNDGRRARLVFAGQPAETMADAQTADALVRESVVRLGLGDDVIWAGAVDDIPGLLASGDVLVSASAHEGLSLVHLEALAMQRPVACTATAGTRETAHGNPAMRVLPLEAGPADFAAAILAAENSADETTRAAARRRFDFRWMADRYAGVYRRCVAERHGAPHGIWLVTNNFSMGGAQTSARRLLVAMAGLGIPVRAVTVQEHPDQPTAGCRALRLAGVTVRAVGPHGTLTPDETADQIFDALDGDPPEAVLFWNLIPVYKLLLADGCRDARVFDVSPGEMFFQSLHQYFEKPYRALPFISPADYGRRLSGVIVKYQAESAAAAALGVPVHVIPNGVPLPPLRERAIRPGPGLVFGTATRISPQKRLEDVIAALQLAQPILPPFEFRIAGRIEPGCEAYHEGLLKLSAGLPVTWLGELPSTENFLPDLDIFLMSSEPAGCPNALLEALAAGLPTIATDVGGAGEQVIDGVTGRLVPARDVAAFAAAIVAVAQESEAAAQLGQNARRHLAEHFSLTKMVGAYRDLCLDSHGTANHTPSVLT